MYPTKIKKKDFYWSLPIRAIIVLTISLAFQIYSFGQPLDNNQNQTSAEVSEIKSELSGIKEKVNQRPKDFWDKLSAISTLLSGVLVTVIGLYATNLYNRRQREKEQALRAESCPAEIKASAAAVKQQV